MSARPNNPDGVVVATGCRSMMNKRWVPKMFAETHFPVLLVLLVAVAGPLLAELPVGFRIPAVVLEVVLGIIIGPQVLGLVHFDGHVDTWPESFGLVWGHGSPFYHAIEEGLVDPRHMIQVGIRSPLHRDIFDWTVGKGVTIVTAEEVHESGPREVAERIRAVLGDGPCYLSFDIDALDPAFAPGTGTPEVGGLATWQARAILRRLAGIRFVGMDIVEVSPPYDVAEITALAAATMAWDYLGLLAPRAK